jgi:hypothetical protein
MEESGWESQNIIQGVALYKKKKYKNARYNYEKIGRRSFQLYNAAAKLTPRKFISTLFF